MNINSASIFQYSLSNEGYEPLGSLIEPQRPLDSLKKSRV